MANTTRYESPVQGPQGLAWAGDVLWVTSAANGRLYAIDPRNGSIKSEFVPPHEALGITRTSSDFRLVLAPAIEEPELELDHRFVYSFSPSDGFAECFACPDFSGSFVAADGEAFFVSQAWDKRIVQVDAHGAPIRTIELELRPVGITIVDGAFYMVCVNDDWGGGVFQRLPVQADASAIQTLAALPFKPRSVAFDGERFWTADRDNHGIVALG